MKKTKAAKESARTYRAALEQLGLTVASQRTARLLGVTVRRSQRLAAGDAIMPGSLDLLLKMYLKHGLDDAEEE